MDKKLVDFDIPQYITEEIQQYTNDCKNGNCRCMKWENIKSLIGLAVISNRITKEQGEYLRKTFCQSK